MRNIRQEALEHLGGGVVARTLRWSACGDLSDGSVRLVTIVTSEPPCSMTASQSDAHPLLS